MSRGASWRGGAVVSVFLIFVVAVLVLLPPWLHPPLDDAVLRDVADAEKRIQLQQAQGQLQNSVRATLLQAVAGLLVLAGAAATWRQVQVSREGQITERFTRAIDQLGSDNQDIRIGGAYALERIARNSPEDRNTVQFIMGAFIRNHAPWNVDEPRKRHPPDVDLGDPVPWLQHRMPDVQAIITVLARRPVSAGTPRLVLSRVDLRRVLLPRDGRLTDAVFRHTNLAQAWLMGVDLRRCDLTGVDLRRANLEDAVLTGARLRYASLVGANLTHVDLSGADLRHADLRETDLDTTRLDGALADAATRWPEDFDEERRRDAGIRAEAGTAT